MGRKLSLHDSVGLRTLLMRKVLRLSTRATREAAANMFGDLWHVQVCVCFHIASSRCSKSCFKRRLLKKQAEPKKVKFENWNWEGELMFVPAATCKQPMTKLAQLSSVYFDCF